MPPKKHRSSRHRVPAHPAVLVPLSVPLILQGIALLYSTRYTLFSITSCILHPPRACVNGFKRDNVLECFRESDHPTLATTNQAAQCFSQDAIPTQLLLEHHQSSLDHASKARGQNLVACFDGCNKKCDVELSVTANEESSIKDQSKSEVNGHRREPSGNMTPRSTFWH